MYARGFQSLIKIDGMSHAFYLVLGIYTQVNTDECEQRLSERIGLAAGEHTGIDYAYQGLVHRCTRAAGRSPSP